MKRGLLVVMPWKRAIQRETTREPFNQLLNRSTIDTWSTVPTTDNKAGLASITPTRSLRDTQLSKRGASGRGRRREIPRDPERGQHCQAVHNLHCASLSAANTMLRHSRYINRLAEKWVVMQHSVTAQRLLLLVVHPPRKISQHCSPYTLMNVGVRSHIPLSAVPDHSRKTTPLQLRSQINKCRSGSVRATLQGQIEVAIYIQVSTEAVSCSARDRDRSLRTGP